MMNRFIINDPKQCVGCYACEVACVMAHNEDQMPLSAEQFRPRIRVIKGEQFKTAVTCRHCEAAPCLTTCPNDAISRVDDSIQVNQMKCIGCKSCEAACPFGAMQVIATENDDGSTTAEALKCDLCEGREEGPACVQNCPNNALSVMSQEVLDTLAKERRVRSAMLGSQSWNPQKSGPREIVSDAINKVHEMAAAESRQDPNKIPLETRKSGFDELYITFTPEQAAEQSKRCLKCGEHSICEWSCPLHNHIPQWIDLVKQGRIMEAVELSHQTNCIPEITGRICPQDRLCESRCTMKDESGAVTIGNIERFISEAAFASGWRPDLSGVEDTGKRVAIIGAGPAGLGCADVLARHGVKAVVFDRNPEIGGLLTFGIPAFKLDKNILKRRREIFTDMGIEFQLNCEIGDEITFDQLLEEFDAVFVGVGTYRPMQARLPNEEAPGVYEALPYLIANTRQLMELPEDSKTPYISMTDKHVVVLGGGDTTMDCVRTALRQGATQVTCAYRRDEANMPGSRKEVKNAREEGAQFEFNVQPVNIELNEADQVSGIRMLRTQLGEPDADGRRRPVAIEGSEFVMPADAVIVAFGFLPHSLPWLKAKDVKMDNKGRIVAMSDDQFSQQTSNPKIFAGGDAVRGADLVVTALAEGRHAAGGIMSYLGVDA